MPSSILSFLTAILAAVGLLLGGGSAALASLVPAAVEGAVEEAGAAEESETHRARRARRLARRTASTIRSRAPEPGRRRHPARGATTTAPERWARATPRRGPPPGTT